MKTNNNMSEINAASRTTVINVSVLEGFLDTVNYIDEGEIVSHAIGFIDHPDDSITKEELIKAAARIYADVHFLKSEMNKLIKPLVSRS